MTSFCCGFVVHIDDKIWGGGVGCIAYLPSNSVFPFKSFISRHATMHVHFDMERCKENISNPDITPLFTAISVCKSK